MSTINLNDVVHKIEAADSDLASSKFEDVRLSGSTFSEVSLAQSTFNNVLFDGSTITKASMVGVSFSDCQYEGMTIEGVPVKVLFETYQAAQKGSGKP
ncbi:pentapeptide repeat-containing protein [Hyalangium minutum]|uniref:Pentapeptide repeat-containing protein n=1 Tax=Hyalangium minutum TaxID=394096 RepID=A0A085WP86_9BACT|nr:pentapeptide repeat-containing protein [Hyalangium minutum]KFE69499.1 hypothetical protein DB31_6474 [Hyalangium minutum]